MVGTLIVSPVSEIAVLLSMSVLGWVNLAIMGGMALASYLANRNKKNPKTTTRNPLDPEFGPLQASVLSRSMARLDPRTRSSLPNGFEQTGIRGINDTFSAGRGNLENILTSRGLSTSPIAANVLGRHEGARLGNIGNFRTQLPLLNRELENEDIGIASRLLGMGRNTTEQEFQEPNNTAGNVAMDVMSMLGYMYGQGAFRGGGGGRGGITGGGFGAGSGLPSYPWFSLV